MIGSQSHIWVGRKKITFYRVKFYLTLKINKVSRNSKGNHFSIFEEWLRVPSRVAKKENTEQRLWKALE